MDFFIIQPEWKNALAQAGLDNLDSLLSFSGGDCLSYHLRGKTSKFILPSGQAVFIKQDHFTKWKTTAHNLLRLRKPQPNTEKERLCLALAARHGLIVPEVVAWGQRRRFGLPHQGVMVMLPVGGLSLPDFLQQEKSPDKRAEAISQAEQTLIFMQENKLDWRIDCKPEHFFVLDDGKIALIDLERLRLRKKPLLASHCKMQLARFRSLLPSTENTK